MTIPKNNLVREASIPHGLWSSVWSLNFKYKWRDPYFSLRKKKKKVRKAELLFICEGLVNMFLPQPDHQREHP